MVAAIINNGIVENVIVIEPAGIFEFQKAIGCDFLVPVDESVLIGHSYDEKTGIFTDENGVRIYPPKTEAERIDELEAQIVETQAALIELAGIVGGADDDGNG